MLPKVVNYIPVPKSIRFANTVKHCWRTFCSKNEDNVKNDEKVDEKSENENFITLDIPEPKYTDVNAKKSLLNTLKCDLEQTLKFIKHPFKENRGKRFIPNHYDIAIFGAGPVGSTLAHHLRERMNDKMGVIVIDSDLSPNRFIKSDAVWVLKSPEKWRESRARKTNDF